MPLHQPRNTVISRLYFWLAYELQRAETNTKIFCLVRGLFHEDKKTHMKAVGFRALLPMDVLKALLALKLKLMFECPFS